MQSTRSFRLFLGFSINQTQSIEIYDLQQKLKPNINTDAIAIPSANLHMTLGFLGLVNPNVYHTLITAINEMPKGHCNQIIDTLTLWEKPQIISLKGKATPQLQTMAQTVNAIAKMLNLYHTEHDYIPHISLFRHAKTYSPPIIASEICLEIAPTNLHLYQSVNTTKTVNYSIFRSWPLV